VSKVDEEDIKKRTKSSSSLYGYTIGVSGAGIDAQEFLKYYL
jgi:hypothetical protein